MRCTERDDRGINRVTPVGKAQAAPDLVQPSRPNGGTAMTHKRKLAARLLIGSAVTVVAAAAWADGDWDDLFKISAIRAAIAGNLTISSLPGTFQAYGAPQDAASAAGFAIGLPTWSPDTWTTTTSFVVTNREMDVSMPTNGLSASLLSLLGLINPSGQSQSPDPNVLALDTIASPLVDIVYQDTSHTVELAQAPGEDVVAPTQLNLPVLVEIRLALSRIELEDSRRFANAIDWRAAMLIPLPAQIGWMKIVKVNGNPGVLVHERVRDHDDAPSNAVNAVSAILWSAGTQLYGMRGNIEPDDLLSMARSVK